MQELINAIKEYKSKNLLTDEQCADNLKLTVEDIKSVDSGKLTLSSEEQERVLAIIQKKTKSTGKRVVRILDLCFRFISAIMSFVVLLLCINGYENTNTLVLLLAIGFVCTSITTLPKIEK